MERPEKDSQIDMLKAGFEESPLALCADYRGLTVSKISELRGDLKKAGAKSKVVKNTLARISANAILGEGASADELERFIDVFSGPSLLIFSGEDIVSSAKVLSKFEKENEILSIKGAWFEGSFVDKKGVVGISTMPSREEILSSLLRLINTPATQLARVVQAPGQQLAQVVEAYKNTLN